MILALVSTGVCSTLAQTIDVSSRWSPAASAECPNGAIELILRNEEGDRLSSFKVGVPEKGFGRLEHWESGRLENGLYTIDGRVSGCDRSPVEGVRIRLRMTPDMVTPPNVIAICDVEESIVELVWLGVCAVHQGEGVFEVVEVDPPVVRNVSDEVFRSCMASRSWTYQVYGHHAWVSNAQPLRVDWDAKGGQLGPGEQIVARPLGEYVSPPGRRDSSRVGEMLRRLVVHVEPDPESSAGTTEWLTTASILKCCQRYLVGWPTDEPEADGSSDEAE